MKVRILPGCIACGACESINSEIFQVTDIAHINEEAIEGNETDCFAAAEACPVDVIEIDE